MTYKEQLLDPRWQIKRLKILERDNFSCTLCGDKKTTFHIHHEKYSGYAWEADDATLKTLCSHCHLLEEYYKKNYTKGVTIIKVNKRESIADFLIIYVHRINNNTGNRLLDIFSINKKGDKIELETIFCEKDLNTFYDFIKSIINPNA